MSAVKLKTELDAWVQWSRVNLSASADIPVISTEDLFARAPWWEKWHTAFQLVLDRRDEVVQYFADALAREPADIPTRFTALNLFLGFSGWPDESNVEWAHSVFEVLQEEVDKFMKESFENLCLLVRLLKVDELPNDWPLIRWEIINSYAISDWDRALELYNRAEELGARPQAELQAMRGQFNYLRVFGRAMEAPLESLIWRPGVVTGEGDKNGALLLILSGLRLSQYRIDVADVQRTLLLDAASDLEKALTLDPELVRIYNPVLARCWFFAGHPEVAEKFYQAALSIYGKASPEFKRWIYESLGLIYEASNQTDKLIQTLERFANDFPAEKGLHLRIAEYRARRGDFEGVPESLRRELDVNPEADRDWKISALVALGDIRDVSARLVSMLKERPDTWHLAATLIEEYWPALSRLTDGAREEWIAGTILWHERRDDPSHAVWRRKAIHSYANAVELELSARLFTRFREHVMATPRL